MSTDGPVKRYRCSACGNLTRFDVTSTRRTRAFHHYSVSGSLTVDDTEVLDEDVEDVSCRWCGNGSAVVEYTADTDGRDTGTAGRDTEPAGSESNRS